MIVYNIVTCSSKNKGNNDCENYSRVKLVVDEKNTDPQGIFFQQQENTAIFTIVTLEKSVTHNSKFETL